MRKQVLIIGLGQFGMSLAKTLSAKGFDVIAADMNIELVNEASSFAADAFCINAIDESSLSKLSPKDREIVICSIREREPSILAAALLRQMGCENIIARASEPIHARILKAVGAKLVINPEMEYGRKFANKIIFQNIFHKNHSGDIELIEIPIPKFMEGRSLIELKLPDRYGLLAAGIYKNNELHRPIPAEKLEPGSSLMLIGSNEAVEKMLKENR